MEGLGAGPALRVGEIRALSAGSGHRHPLSGPWGWAALAWITGGLQGSGWACSSLLPRLFPPGAEAAATFPIL